MVVATLATEVVFAGKSDMEIEWADRPLPKEEENIKNVHFNIQKTKNM
jgi:hypothetical protein